jgi:phosphate/sulfate permease
MVPPPAHEVLGAMITPAVLISASGTLVLSTSNRLSRVVDRVRTLALEAETLDLDDPTKKPRAELIANQLERLSARVVLLRNSMTALYTAIGLLVGTSIAVGLAAVLSWEQAWIPIVLGLLGSVALLYGSLLLVREARLAVGSTLQELDFVQGRLGKTKGPTPP